MKFNKIALAVLATATTAASAGVTVSPLLLGYHYNDEAHDKQREVLRTGKTLETNQKHTDGVALESDLWVGAALGVELTPSTQLQVEYGLSSADAQASKKSAEMAANRFDSEQQTISGNFLIGLGNSNAKLKPYVLIGAGQQKTKVENQVAYTADAANAPYGDIAQNQQVAAGTKVTSSKDTIGNIGLGARYLVNDALALRGEARAIHNFDNKWWEGLALAGLEVTLGGRLAPAAVIVEPVVPVVPVEPVVPVVEEPVEEITVVEPVETIIDSDFDGVPDHLDACPDTPRNVVVDARGCPQTVVLEEQLRRELRVFFDRDQSAIKPQFREEVAKVAQSMNEFPNATAVIEGHASKDSNRSSAKYNQRLSEARANAVKLMLANEFGIAPNRLSAIGYGFDRPIAPNTTDEGRALNRRVIAVITGNKSTTVEQTKDMVIR
ncbi:OmpA family protein [Moraxella haemolytica]|uniref:OmpA family protein n=1 Tax=Moraxella haemolytica TaxID=2904119 RepID=UPI002542A35C|nr:OmpA family protein [Moraxella sp. ZY171148]WII95394.1 OmpA family protein [Moraxella sp. ZY171148]